MMLLCAFGNLLTVLLTKVMFCLINLISKHRTANYDVHETLLSCWAATTMPVSPLVEQVPTTTSSCSLSALRRRRLRTGEIVIVTMIMIMIVR